MLELAVETEEARGAGKPIIVGAIVIATGGHGRIETVQLTTAMAVA